MSFTTAVSEHGPDRRAFALAASSHPASADGRDPCAVARSIGELDSVGYDDAADDDAQQQQEAHGCDQRLHHRDAALRG